MKRIGLTGGIGTGKTIVAQIFEGLGIPVFFADIEAKRAYSDMNVLKEIKLLLGEDVFDDQKINFIKLSNLVFSNNVALEKLNNIIHPFVLNKFEVWIGEHADAPYILMESAILFETGYHSIFNKIITVTAATELCISRVMNRDGVDRSNVLKRMANQLPNETKVELSDYRIQNDNDQLLTPQVIEIHKSILALT